MIAIIDYGAGNLKSVKNALDFLRLRNKITDKAEEIEKADKIVFPGVGSFGDVMEVLEKKGLIKVLRKVIKKNKPYLGICLGLQALFEESEESAGASGLGIFKGRVKRFNSQNIKIPQIGWNSVNINKKNKNNVIFEKIKNDSYFYFVHSYYVAPEDNSIILTTTDYGGEFVSSIAKNNIFGVQFHPERSGSIGLRLLKNFADC